MSNTKSALELLQLVNTLYGRLQQLKSQPEQRLLDNVLSGDLNNNTSYPVAYRYSTATLELEFKELDKIFYQELFTLSSPAEKQQALHKAMQQILAIHKLLTEVEMILSYFSSNFGFEKFIALIQNIADAFNQYIICPDDDSDNKDNALVELRRQENQLTNFFFTEC